MSKVVFKKIEDTFVLQRGFDITKSIQKKGAYPVVSSSGISSFHNEFKVKAPGVVIGRKGTLGTSFYLESDFWPHDTTLWVKDFKGNNPYYIYCLLQLLKLEKLDSGSANPTLNRNFVHQLLIPVLSGSDQNDSVQTMKLIDQKVSLNNRIISELEAMAKTIYDYWFVQFDFPNAEGKPYRQSGGTMVYNEALKREIPKGWEVKPVKDLLDVVTGKEDANFSTLNGKYKFFTCAQDPLQCDEYSFDGRAVLIAGNGDFNVKHYSGKFNAYQRTYVLIPREEKYFAAIYIVANNRITQFKNGSNGSIVKFITKGDVENIQIVLPDNDEYFYNLNKMFDLIEGKQRENLELTRLRDWLLPMLMNGQATVE